MDRYRSWPALLIASSLVSCAGNGNGLDQNGQLIPDGGSAAAGQITADLKSIEDNVFTPICSKCHIGASAPEGLQLDAAHAYNFLVGVPSAEEPGLLRVNPGNPDASYMVMKIEGAPGIEGGQMPLGETPLPQATIDAIRQWITDGAPNVSGAAAVQQFALDSTDPMDRSTVSTPPRRIIVAFTDEVDASLVNDTTVTLERIAGSGGAQTIPVSRQLVTENPGVLLLRPGAALGAGVYRVRLRGTGGAALADVTGRTLGVDTSFVFSVETLP